jgi:hypothetical protein
MAQRSSTAAQPHQHAQAAAAHHLVALIAYFEGKRH